MWLKEFIRGKAALLWINHCPLPSAVKQLAQNFMLNDIDKERIQKYIYLQNAITKFWESKKWKIKQEIENLWSPYAMTPSWYEDGIYNIVTSNLKEFYINNEFYELIRPGLATAVNTYISLSYIYKSKQSKSNISTFEAIKWVSSELATNIIMWSTQATESILKNHKSSDKIIDEKFWKLQEYREWFHSPKRFVINEAWKMILVEEFSSKYKKILLSEKNNLKSKMILWCPAMYSPNSSHNWEKIVLFDMAKIICDQFDKYKSKY